jgi:uncharacterized protein YhjY with autotransporter beta-barrel domain
VAGTRGPGAQEDAALRRRRERARHPQSTAAESENPADYTLFNTGASGAFFSLDYLHERQKTTLYEAGRTANQYGGTLGLDHRFGATALLGLAVRYNYQSGDFANRGGDFLMRTYGSSLYGSWFPLDNAFIDVTAGFDYKKLDITRIVGRRQVITLPRGSLISYNPELTPVNGDTDSRQPLAEIRVGYDLPIAAFTVGPRAAMTWRHTQVDSFSETGVTPMTLVFDEQTDTSLRSALGLQTSKAFSNEHGVLVPQLNVDWVHEYRADQHMLTARFAEDLRPTPTVLRFLNQAPDRDFFVARLSTVAVLKHGFNAFLSVESTAGHQYIDRYTVVLGARAEL